MIDQVLAWTREALASGGSIGLAVVMLLENLFPPIPSEVVLPYAGFLVSTGRLPLPQAMAASTTGSLIGALVLYALGRYGGRPLVLRYRRVLHVSERDLDRADAWFDGHGPKIVLIARMVPVARSIVSLPAGWSEMPLWRFVLLTVVGTAGWNALLIGCGVLLGANYEQASRVVGTVSDAMVVISAILLVGGLAWWVRAGRRRSG